MAGSRTPTIEAEFNENIATARKQITSIITDLNKLDIPSNNQQSLTKELHKISDKIDEFEKNFNAGSTHNQGEVNALNKTIGSLLYAELEKIIIKTTKEKTFDVKGKNLSDFIQNKIRELTNIDRQKQIAVEKKAAELTESKKSPEVKANEAKAAEVSAAEEKAKTDKIAVEKAKEKDDSARKAKEEKERELAKPRTRFEDNFIKDVEFLKSRLDGLKSDLSHYTGKNGKIVTDLTTRVSQMLASIDKLTKDMTTYNRLKDSNPLVEKATRESMETELKTLTSKLDGDVITSTLTRKAAGGFIGSKTVVNSDPSLTSMLNDAKADSVRNTSLKIKFSGPS